VCSSRPIGRYIETPPFLCVHLPANRRSIKLIETRIDEYLDMGVPFVWLLDPETKRGWVYTRGGRTEALDGWMRTVNPSLEMPLSEAFDG